MNQIIILRLKKILIKAKKNEKSVIGHDIMNMLEIYSNKLVENNNITKHENNEKEIEKLNNNKDLKDQSQNLLSKKRLRYKVNIFK